MTAYTKVSGAWRTVSAAAFKMSGAWRTATSMFVRGPWPVRYASAMLPPNYLKAPALWGIPYGYSAQPAPVVEGGAIRLTWTIAAGATGMRGISIVLRVGVTYDITLTTTDAPAGVPWRVLVSGVSGLVGNDVVGPGTSTLAGTATTNGTMFVGLQTDQGADATAGHLVTSMTVIARNAAPVVPNDSIPFTWKQSYPAVGSGPPTLLDIRREKATLTYGSWYRQYIQYNDVDGHWGNSRWMLPAVPFYRVIGDTSQIASAKVTMTFTPAAPKSPVEHTISWEAPVGWALYHIGYMGDDGYTHFYYAALTDSEFATEKAKPDRLVTRMWSPREGGWFVWMPVCWDTSGVTVPMRAEVADTADSGNDIYSGYTPFPPNRSATSALADYTVTNGYSDMNNFNLAYTSITVELKNSGGTVLDSWTGPLAAGQTVDSPGLGNTPATRVMLSEDYPQLYWPEEWQGLFEDVPALPQKVKVVYGRQTIHGWAEWDVLGNMDNSRLGDSPDWQKIGDFRLALHRKFPDVIEIGGVNLRPDLVGGNIMRTIVEHGVLYSPTRWVVVKPPDPLTFAVMQSWGWKSLEQGSEALLHAFWMHGDEEDNPDLYLGMESSPITNRFFWLGMPPSEEVDPWSE